VNTQTGGLSVKVLQDPLWQMTYGERFALEGILTQVKPRLALETGTAQGGSLRRIAEHSDEVHAFDIVPEVKELEKQIPNATVHIGDSAIVLPETLAGFVQDGRTVDFALIDGDHSYEGVRRDTMAVIDSDACQTTVMVFHDSANDEVRAGLESLDLPSHPKVAVCMWDFVPGYLVVEGHETYSLAAWNGLGLVILDPDAGKAPAITMGDRYNVTEVYQRVRPLYDPAPQAAAAPEPQAALPAAVAAPKGGRKLAAGAALGTGVAGAALGALLGARRRS
jgi:hypothetical protein